jgi:hypothetical protein
MTGLEAGQCGRQPRRPPPDVVDCGGTPRSAIGEDRGALYPPVRFVAVRDRRSDQPRDPRPTGNGPSPGWVPGPGAEGPPPPNSPGATPCPLGCGLSRRGGGAGCVGLRVVRRGGGADGFACSDDEANPAAAQQSAFHDPASHNSAVHADEPADPHHRSHRDKGSDGDERAERDEPAGVEQLLRSLRVSHHALRIPPARHPGVSRWLRPCARARKWLRRGVRPKHAGRPDRRSCATLRSWARSLPSRRRGNRREQSGVRQPNVIGSIDCGRSSFRVGLRRSGPLAPTASGRATRRPLGVDGPSGPGARSVETAGLTPSGGVPALRVADPASIPRPPSFARVRQRPEISDDQPLSATGVH